MPSCHSSFALALPPPLLAPHGDTPSHLYNFFMGRELNPRTGAFDWKEFCELYPGLIGWVVLDLAAAAKQAATFGAVSPGMACVCAFHFIYVADALWHER